MTKVIKYYIPLLTNQENSDELCQKLKEIEGVLAVDTDLQRKKCSITYKSHVELVDIVSAIEKLNVEYYFLSREMI